MCGDENECGVAGVMSVPSPEARSHARQVHVRGRAELSSPPDRAAVTVSVRSTKDSVNDVTNSVTRRLDYILQTMRQHGVQEEDTAVRKHVRREGDLYSMQTEVSVVFSDFEKMQRVRSVLIEKLDRSVCVGEPRFEHSSQCLNLLRRHVCAEAVETARLKANDICSILGQALGQPLLVREEESQEWGCGQEGPALPLKLQQKAGQTLVCASSCVCVIFELQPKNSTKKL
uniref:Interleukin-1 receptor-associated kinase 1 binding protein 1 n=2 Tax=Electrophorus electricus TaxID=8005 RepID=A0AAY5E9L6_ELEEL